MNKPKITLNDLFTMANKAFDTFKSTATDVIDYIKTNLDTSAQRKINAELANDKGKNDGYYIEMAEDKDKQLEEIIDRLPDWKKLNLAERKSFSEDMLSYILASSGISVLALSHTDDIQDSLFGLWDNSDMIEISKKSVIALVEPYRLFEVLNHETRHYKQNLANTLTKKQMKEDDLYFPLGYYLQGFNDNEDIYNSSDGMYESDIGEQDSNLFALNELYKLKNKILKSKPFSLKYYKEIKKLDERVYELECLQQDFLYKNIKFNSSPRPINEMIAKRDFSLQELNKLLSCKPEIIQHLPQDVDDKLTSLIAIYLSSANNQSLYDEKQHIRLTKRLVELGKLESIQAVNILWYQHSPEDLHACVKMLKDKTGEKLLIPTAFKYLTHIDGNELLEEVKSQMDPDYFRVSHNALLKMLNSKLEEQPALKHFKMVDVEKELDANNPNHWSYLINNLSPETYGTYMITFMMDYFPYLRQTFDNDEILIADQNKARKVENIVTPLPSESDVDAMDKIDYFITKYKKDTNNRPENTVSHKEQDKQAEQIILSDSSINNIDMSSSQSQDKELEI